MFLERPRCNLNLETSNFNKKFLRLYDHLQIGILSFCNNIFFAELLSFFDISSSSLYNRLPRDEYFTKSFHCKITGEKYSIYIGFLKYIENAMIFRQPTRSICYVCIVKRWYLDIISKMHDMCIKSQIYYSNIRYCTYICSFYLIFMGKNNTNKQIPYNIWYIYMFIR